MSKVLRTALTVLTTIELLEPPSLLLLLLVVAVVIGVQNEPLIYIPP